MQHEFWEDRWQAGQIGFHRSGVSPDLEANAPWFLREASHRVLVPLAGKSWDLPWLAAQGHRVTGSELVAKAVQELFDEHPRTVEQEPVGDHVVWRSEHLHVWQGDFFTLPASAGPFDRVWDRAALVALRPDMREDYVRKVRELAPGAIILLNGLDYDPAAMSGPPFPVPPEEVRRLYGTEHVEELATTDVLEREPRWRERGHAWFRSTLYRISLPSNT